MSVFSQLDLTLLEYKLKKIGVIAHLGSNRYCKLSIVTKNFALLAERKSATAQRLIFIAGHGQIMILTVL